MFYASRGADILKANKISPLVFSGLAWEVCAQTSMRDTNCCGYQCVIMQDATTSFFPRFKAAAIDMIRAQRSIAG